jgi:hypothetical protein
MAFLLAFLEKCIFEMIPLYNLRLAYDSIWLLQCSDLKFYGNVLHMYM